VEEGKQYTTDKIPRSKERVHNKLNPCTVFFRERVSYKGGDAYAKLSKVTMGNRGFYGCLIEAQGVSVLGRKQHKPMY